MICISQVFQASKSKHKISINALKKDVQPCFIKGQILNLAKVGDPQKGLYVKSDSDLSIIV